MDHFDLEKVNCGEDTNDSIVIDVSWRRRRKNCWEMLLRFPPLEVVLWHAAPNLWTTLQTSPAKLSRISRNIPTEIPTCPKQE